LRFGFHGFAIEVETSWPELADVLAQRLHHLGSATDEGPQLAFKYWMADRPANILARPEGPSRPVYETPRGQVEYFPQTDSLFLDYADEARLLIRPARSEVLIAFRPGAEALWLASHPLLTLPLVELLKRRALFSVHAAGLALTGRSLLLAGTTGAGKSTLTLALLQRGLDLLGDDMTFLRIGPAGLRTLAFPDEIDVTPHTLGMFPELAERLPDAGRPGWKKLQLDAATLGGPTVAWESEPVALVFPTIAGSETSSLTSLTTGEALVELAPNVILTERASSQAHLGALGELVKHCQCYRLHTGTDLTQAAYLLESLLQRPEKS
jgi:hypothetical protein